MTNATISYAETTKKTTTGQCEACWEMTAATGDQHTCDRCDRPVTVTVVGAALMVNGVDYGEKQFEGPQAQAEAEAWGEMILGALGAK